MPHSLPQAILLVDGYNVVGHWLELKHLRDREGLGEARRLLTEYLINYSAFHDYDTRLVFDAQYQQSPCKREVITANLSVCYTDFGQTADTYIEKACAAFRNDLRKFQQRLIVATSDRAQQLTVVGYGAELMTVDQLTLAVATADQRVRQKHKPTKAKKTGRSLGHRLDPVAFQRLSAMRFGKSGEA
mgnify:FL=1